jgi:hypothetical protein
VRKAAWLLAVAALATGAVVTCRSDASARSPDSLDLLRREHDILHDRLQLTLGRDSLARRVFGQRGEVAIATRPRFVTDIVEEMAHRYLDEVDLDLSALRTETEGTVRARTFLGLVKAGEWQLDVTIDDLRGRLQAGHPKLRFHSDRIEIEMPVKVRPAFGTVTLDFAWDSAGLANVVCGDFKLSRKLEGRVLEQEHVLVGAVSVSQSKRALTATPVFAERKVSLRVDLTPESWASVEAALRSQDTLGRCGLLLKPEAVLAQLRELAARGIRVKLPDVLFQSARLPAQLERQVALGNRVIELSLKSEAVRVRSDLLWTSGSIEVGAGGTVTGRESAPGRLDTRPPEPSPGRRPFPHEGGPVAYVCARAQE